MDYVVQLHLRFDHIRFLYPVLYIHTAKLASIINFCTSHFIPRNNMKALFKTRLLYPVYPVTNMITEPHPDGYGACHFWIQICKTHWFGTFNLIKNKYFVFHIPYPTMTYPKKSHGPPDVICGYGICSPIWIEPYARISWMSSRPVWILLTNYRANQSHKVGA